MFLAGELMKAGGASVSRIAYECGYDNYSYFTKVFKSSSFSSFSSSSSSLPSVGKNNLTKKPPQLVR